MLISGSLRRMVCYGIIFVDARGRVLFPLDSFFSRNPSSDDLAGADRLPVVP